MSGYLLSCALDGTDDDDGPATLLTSIETENEDTSSLPSPPRSCRHMNTLFVHAILLLLASTTFTLWIISIQTPCPLDPLLTYSPVNEAIQYVEKRFDASLNSSSVFRGYPSPAIDAAWKRVSIDVKATRLSHKQFLMVGGNDNHTAVIKYRPEDGGGYMSQVDGYHHIHCLDLLRKYIWKDYYAPFDASFNNLLRPHLAHCVEIIRQKLMCTSDLTMITYDYKWIPDLGLTRPRPNLSTMHQCIDYERILEWSAEHNAHVLASHVVKFEGATELAEPPT